MSTLSVVLAVFNEEKTLDQCLDSVKGLADEIVIVDGGSEDTTLEIAKKHKAKIIQTDNPVIFHINKNIAIKAASKDWVLQLDADEVVSSHLAAEIKEVINLDSKYNGYWVPRSNYFLGRFLKKGGQYPDYTLRLYKNGKGILPAKDVHEQAQVEGPVGYLKSDLLHYRDLTFAKYLDGLNRYTNIIAIQMEESKESLGVGPFINYFLIKPMWWFIKTFIRHRGYVDGFPGFVFSYFSALRFPISYIKYWSAKNADRN
jgi:glycosyltransferase involved in cell wall biosynthesis